MREQRIYMRVYIYMRVCWEQLMCVPHTAVVTAAYHQRAVLREQQRVHFHAEPL
jgi:hypothetical protein